MKLRKFQVVLNYEKIDGGLLNVVLVVKDQFSRVLASSRAK